MTDAARECAWNVCDECGEIVDVDDDSIDGALSVCSACNTAYELVERFDGSCMLIAVNPMTIESTDDTGA